MVEFKRGDRVIAKAARGQMRIGIIDEISRYSINLYRVKYDTPVSHRGYEYTHGTFESKDLLLEAEVIDG